MDIKFTDEQLQQVITKAIFDTLSAEQKEELLKKAVSSLLQPAENRGYSTYRKTQLQEAYERAAYQVAQSIIVEEMKNDETFKANVKKLYADASEKVFAGDSYQKLVDKTAGNIIEVLTSNR